MQLLWFFMFSNALISKGAEPIGLVSVGTSWKYLSDSNYFPTNASWRLVGYDDAAWPSGLSGFSTLREEATWLTNSAVSASVLFRKSFVVQNTEAIQSLILRVNYNSGFAAFLNGEEVARKGLPEGEIDYGIYAPTSRMQGAAEEISLTAFTNLLTAGENILAVQLHSALDTPHRKMFVLELLANFQRGPFVQNVSPTSAQIVWQSSQSILGQVVVGLTSNDLNQSFASMARGWTQTATLTNLLSSTRYFYQVRSFSSGAPPSVSPIFSFGTFREYGDVTFAVIGDTGGGTVAQYNVARQLLLSAPDLVLHLGDIIYDTFKASSADLRFLSVYRDQMSGVPWFTTIGNHDIDASERDQAYLDTLVLPTNPISGTEHYYSFDHGDAHFVCLFVPDLKFRPDLAHLSLTNDSLQYQWLTNDLARSSKPWKFLFFHLPVSTSSFHSGEDQNANNFSDQEELQAILLPLGRRYGVQGIFNGHDHNFERFAPVQGVHRIVSGGGGRSVYSMFQRDQTSAQFYARYHFLRASLTSNSLKIQAIDQFGSVFDEMIISRGESSSHDSVWHTPLVESTTADDGDGNIIGQQYDLNGPEYVTRSGEWSNLGRFHVNNDSTNLYLGLRDVMIPNNSDIYLFLEGAPGSGVSQLAELGNGGVGPAGAIALACAENLRFTNFFPAIGAIVGDEKADRTFREFNRGGSSLGTGQGVFFLSNSYPEVMNARVQQFNRSPQITNDVGHQGFRAEQNADFIEIAIPLSALGHSQTIRVAVVVGGSGIDVNARVRDFDSAVVGHLSGSGTNLITIEPLVIHLSTGADTDGDSLLDEWEIAHGLDARSAQGQSGADGDPDQDGFKNYSEQFSGTDPQDPRSALHVRLEIGEPDLVRISWDSVIGKRYLLEYSDSPVNNFLPVAGDWPRTASQSDMSFTDAISASAVAGRFYRVRVVR